jgi:hypothetical protein
MRLIKINPDESRETLHDVPGLGVSYRIKHRKPPGSNVPAQEFFAVRLLKPTEGDGAGRESEYYVEMSRDEALTLVYDLARLVKAPEQPI